MDMQMRMVVLFTLAKTTMEKNLSSTEKLFEKHSSKPYNPKLAEVFFKSGLIEAWGRGFDKIKEACGKYNGLLSEYDMNAGGIMVRCSASESYLELLSKENQRSLSEVLKPSDLEKLSPIIIDIEKNGLITPKEAQDILQKSPATVRRYLGMLVSAGKVKVDGNTNNIIYTWTGNDN